MMKKFFVMLAAILTGAIGLTFSSETASAALATN
jgi:hypothetical protein